MCIPVCLSVCWCVCQLVWGADARAGLENRGVGVLYVGTWWYLTRVDGWCNLSLTITAVWPPGCQLMIEPNCSSDCYTHSAQSSRSDCSSESQTFLVCLCLSNPFSFIIIESPVGIPPFLIYPKEHASPFPNNTWAKKLSTALLFMGSKIN